MLEVISTEDFEFRKPKADQNHHDTGRSHLHNINLVTHILKGGLEKLAKHPD